MYQVIYGRYLSDTSPIVRFYAFEAVERIGVKTQTAESELAQHLNDVPPFPGAYLAAKALVKINPANQHLQSKLREWTNAIDFRDSARKQCDS